MIIKVVPDTGAMLVLPELARMIGLEESIVLQQIHFWICKCGKLRDGKRWIYNTLEQWHEQFKFWSICKVQRIITALEKRGLIESGKFHSNKFNHTKWYTINEEKLALLRDKFGADEEDTLINGIFEEISNFEVTLLPTENGPRLHQDDKIYNTETTKTNNNYLTVTLDKTDRNIISDEEKEIAQKLVGIWKEVLKDRIVLTDKRIKQLNHLWNLVFEEDFENWEVFCKRIKSSKFLNGEKNEFKAHFDWLIKESTVLRIESGEFGVANVRTRKQLQEQAQTVVINNVIKHLNNLKNDVESKARCLEAQAVENIRGSWDIAQEKQANELFEAYMLRSDTSNPSFGQFKEDFRRYGWSMLGIEFFFETFVSEYFLGKGEAAYREEAFISMNAESSSGCKSYEELCLKIMDLERKRSIDLQRKFIHEESKVPKSDRNFMNLLSVEGTDKEGTNFMRGESIMTGG